ncbi:methyltransferase [Ligilactobacillus ceti]|uniref:O-methyltransferase n=1 Tax=Ligilactobacillus ceti DSM 22408 TaxID=1122146 RepID=A0A0R2KPX5_9LACO|nr:methyltransferase [Ligilactobacillus ceti]KRN88682.1 O-methyltransferase [Ligilactobacillus ceti DSM 22408]
MEEITLHENERIDQLFTNEVQVIQSSEVFSFSLDAVLLAHFAEPKRGYKTKLIDFCAGNGAVGLFLSSKTNGQITSVEIQPKLAEMAQRSVRLNNLTERMEVLNIDLNDSLKYLRKDNFDTIVCKITIPHIIQSIPFLTLT